MPEVSSPQSLTNSYTISCHRNTPTDYLTIRYWLLNNAQEDYTIYWDKVVFESEKDAVIFSLTFK